YGLHIAIDTQGFLSPHLDDSWFDSVDLILLDIKHIDPEKHLALTAQPLQPTLDFAERMIRLKKKMWIRYVLVPGWTDNLDDVEKHATYVKKLADMGEEIAPGQKLIERVEVLPFHNMAVSKWTDIGYDYVLTDTPAPSPELTEAVRNIYRAKGLFAT
ncbi:MAG: radical SAM protein, partial [Saezia sp.]